MPSLVCNKTVLDPRHYEGGSLGLGAARTIEVFGMSDRENPLWLRVIGRIKGVLFVIAVAYILCFTSITLLITFLEIDVEAIFASDLLFWFVTWGFCLDRYNWMDSSKKNCGNVSGSARERTFVSRRDKQ